MMAPRAAAMAAEVVDVVAVVEVVAEVAEVVVLLSTLPLATVVMKTQPSLPRWLNSIAPSSRHVARLMPPPTHAPSPPAAPGAAPMTSGRLAARGAIWTPGRRSNGRARVAGAAGEVDGGGAAGGTSLQQAAAQRR